MWVLVISFMISGVAEPALQLQHPFEFVGEESCKAFVTDLDWKFQAEEGFTVVPDCRKVSENV